MKIRLTCTTCNASFLVTDERLGQLVSCPKCGYTERMPGTMEEVVRRTSGIRGDAERGDQAPTAGPGVSTPVFEPSEFEEPRDPRMRHRRHVVPFLIGLIAGLIVAILVLLPLFRRAESPSVLVDRDAPEGPIDPVEQTARQFLEALEAGDELAIDRLSTLRDPPAIASFSDAQRDPRGSETLRGSFAPIAALHARIGEKYTYDPDINRFQNANPMGPAADFLDQAEESRAEAETSDVFDRIAGGTADEQLDAAIEYAELFAGLTKKPLPRTELVPTYSQIVEDADPPLPPEAEALSRRFGEDKETWDELLGRSFFTIEADGPFVLDEAEVVATIQDRLASPGDPPRRLRLRLLRFRLDAIDTGWKVVSARRDDSEERSDSPGNAESVSPGFGSSF